MVQSTKKRLFSKSLALAVIAAMAMTAGAEAYSVPDSANDGGVSTNVAIGENADAKHPTLTHPSFNGNNTAIGYGAKANGGYSTSIGRAATASGFASTSVGANSQATAQNATSLGTGAVSSGTNSTALGAYSDATAQNSTSIGYEAQATGANSVAQGYQAKASGENSTAVGRNANAAGANSTVYGSGANAQGVNSAAFGAGADAGKKDGALAVGTNSTVNGANSSAVGTGGIRERQQRSRIRLRGAGQRLKRDFHRSQRACSAERHGDRLSVIRSWRFRRFRYKSERVSIKLCSYRR